MNKIALPLNDTSDSDVDIKVNKGYAENYDKWRQKEELQKLKDKYGDKTDSSSSESENELVIERDFLKTLSLLKSKDPKIYDANVSFFTAEEKKGKPPKQKKTKPLLWKDYERKMLLKEHAESSDENDILPDKGPTYDEEQQEIKQSFVDALEDSDDDDGDNLLKPREKTKSELEKEDNEYIMWMKRKPKKKSGDEDNEDLRCLRDLWNDPKLEGGEQFLRDYILNEKYKEEKSKAIPTYEEIIADVETLSDDENILKQQELFEYKFNHRFEEPDPEFVKRYPRTVMNSLRNVDGKRKMKREDYRERKLREKEQKKEEILRLKALKRKEIEDKLNQIKEITGNEKLAFEPVDINGDFDPQEHDRKMSEIFGNQYYDVEEEERPSFPEDEELDFENWDNWTGNDADGDYQNIPHCEDPNFNMDADYDPKANFQREMIDSSQKKKKKQSKFASAIKRKKPVFDPTSKTFEDYFDEYYKLDYEDIIGGDLPVRFKYRKVIPNDFGLSVDEMLSAEDKELNRWCSLKKACQYRSEQEELYDVQAFRKKAQNENAKKKIFFSLYVNSDSKNAEKESSCSDKQSKKRKRKKKNMSNDEATLSTNNEEFTNINNAGVEQEDFEGSDLLISKSHSNDNNTTTVDVKPNPSKRKAIETEVSVNLDEGNYSKIQTPDEQPTKSKRKKKKNASKSPFKSKHKHFRSEENEDKRLSLSDNRLKAYGINPKKFKNRIKYSQKRQ